jgi:hypothetical protein
MRLYEMPDGRLMAVVTESGDGTSITPSSPGESHPRALTEPYVTVARYTALVALVTRPWGRG